jgi:hypothetical protein
MIGKQAVYHMSHSVTPFFALGIFEIGSHFFPVLAIFLISASQVARIMGVSPGTWLWT